MHIPKSRFGAPCAGKKTYESEDVALEAAKEVAKEYHHNSRAYFCVYCEKWHLTSRKKDRPKRVL